jgi:hypothetical protein
MRRFNTLTLPFIVHSLNEACCNFFWSELLLSARDRHDPSSNVRISQGEGAKSRTKNAGHNLRSLFSGYGCYRCRSRTVAKSRATQGQGPMRSPERASATQRYLNPSSWYRYAHRKGRCQKRLHINVVSSTLSLSSVSLASQPFFLSGTHILFLVSSLEIGSFPFCCGSLLIH